jgi:hypothetical protein
MTSKTIFDVAASRIELTGEIRGFDNEALIVSSEISIVTTQDGLAAEVSIQRLNDGGFMVRLTEFLSTPAPVYSHLNRNGAMTVQVREDGKWIALLRALRPGGKDYPTLNVVSWEELDSLLGADTKSWLEGLGFETGTWSELNPKAGRFKESLAVAIPPDKGNLLVLPWTLTRVVALMKKLGKPAVVDLS